MQYKCVTCEKIFNHKGHYENHLNRKNKCNKKTPDNNFMECIYCDKSFSTHSNMVRHIKSSCKTFKNAQNEKENIYNKLLKLEEENKELKKNMKKLLKKVDNKSEIQKKITNNNNNNKNCSINNGIINNNITIVAYGKEDISDIYIKQILAAVSRGYQTPVQLTKTLHFNPKHPEFHNIYIPSMKDSYAMVYDGEHWKLVQKTGLIDNIYEDKKEYVEENLEEFSKSLSISKLKALKRWLESDEDDDKCIQKIKKDIELLLYNSKKIPLDTRKMIK